MVAAAGLNPSEWCCFAKTRPVSVHHDALYAGRSLLLRSLPIHCVGIVCMLPYLLSNGGLRLEMMTLLLAAPPCHPVWRCCTLRHHRKVEPLVQEIVVVLQRADEYSGFMLGKMQDRIAAAVAAAAEQQQQKGLQRRSSGATGVSATRSSSAGACGSSHSLPTMLRYVLVAEGTGVMCTLQVQKAGYGGN